MSSFDFYGLSKDQGIKQAARDALDHYGCGSCGPRGFYGTIDQHLDFESAIAKFMGAQVGIGILLLCEALLICCCRRRFSTLTDHLLLPQPSQLSVRKEI